MGLSLSGTARASSVVVVVHVRLWLQLVQLCGVTHWAHLCLGVRRGEVVVALGWAAVVGAQRLAVRPPEVGGVELRLVLKARNAEEELVEGVTRRRSHASAKAAAERQRALSHLSTSRASVANTSWRYSVYAVAAQRCARQCTPSGSASSHPGIEPRRAA